ncbi:MAG TPA: pyridoxamine 5'-phosphate oxidase family protein [Streptosporangiaceae bacterium]|nr:pyridoxamine 5'-phosphate oxidase family protein [Streptosporangiaceae bacterium]
MTTTELTRLRDRAVTDRAELDRLLDDVFLAHIGLSDDQGGVLVIPTAVVRDGDRVLVHGSTGSGWMRRAAQGGPACLTVTELSGIIVARSAFENSLRYRSAVLFGSFTRLAKADVPRALDRFTDHLIPGRVAEIRPNHPRELAATMVLSMPIESWSLKIGTGWPEDGDEDLQSDVWAGVIPFDARQHGDPLPAPDLRPGIPVPASVRAMTQNR